jgi:hypothetical protein
MLFWTVGAPVAGRLSDIVLSKWQVQRKGVWYPEDRLIAAWIGGLFHGATIHWGVKAAYNVRWRSKLLCHLLPNV